MTSQSCQRGPESAHMPHRGPCHTALRSPGSSPCGCGLRPPKTRGGHGKPVKSSTAGSSWAAACLAVLLGLLWLQHVPVAGVLEVKTAETTQVVSLHDNVTVLCEIPGSPRLDITTVGIIWSLKNERNESEVPIYEFYGNHLKVLRPGANVSLLGLERGDASLHLPSIKLSEAGEYRCKLVVTPEKAEGTARIDVVADPALELFVEPATQRNGERLICKLDGFYPEAFDIQWERRALKDSHFQVITEGIITGPTVRNDDGTFSVTSSLVLKPALEDHEVIYYCVVSHRSFHVPKKLNVTLPKKGSVEIYVTIVGPCVLLGVVLILTKVFCPWTW
ncbi:natural cytotoxicity triggering receptor 3 ligand 1 isoform X2 [Mesocricetus auratus]|uniref:Natural cytotoxicity triggering receptor 3 ligand 1 isoform X2 n=1 Tax=Mesocricetus auratus TaxID=10036 RepID=A0A1U8CJP6_MESAU|nr:natural cytotoxicity triggering receptor 3 ligand 1 isoform X2 [Mesocricetus auratus]